ncbi:hypothetical protein [Actinoplanes sp. NPDC049802]|uniref:hypothetical protein n=1 Tax=Actinoplanes sp. NPDC049802 TaxID=3154742 RepID=UPI0033EDEF58
MGKPVSLNKAETETLAEAALEIDPDLVPARRWQEVIETGEYAAAWRSWSQLDTSVEEIVGYMVDSVDGEFACNLMTSSAVTLLRHMTARAAGALPSPELARAYEFLAMVGLWDSLDWRDPLRRGGVPRFLERYPRKFLPGLP